MIKTDEIPLLEYYVYELRDPQDDSVFYVGKGKGDRAKQHEKDALNDEITESAKIKKIKDIQEREINNEVKVVIVGRFNTEDKALAVESTLIKWVYGFDYLENLVHGHHHYSIRDFDNFEIIPHIDINKTYSFDGAYTKNDLKRITNNNYIEKLTLLQQELLKNKIVINSGAKISEADISRPQDPCIWCSVSETIQLQIKISTNRSIDRLIFNLRPHKEKNKSFIEFISSKPQGNTGLKSPKNPYTKLSAHKNPISLYIENDVFNIEEIEDHLDGYIQYVNS